MLGPCWHLFGTCGHDFGTTGHHCGTPGQEVVVWGTHVSNLMRFWLLSGPCGAPFFIIGGHYFDSWGLECWDLCILWATWFQVRFWSKIRWVSEVFGMVKTLKPWFRVGEVVKIIFSLELAFSRFWAQFYGWYQSWFEKNQRADS